jgi:hypothetical protein
MSIRRGISLPCIVGLVSALLIFHAAYTSARQDENKQKELPQSAQDKIKEKLSESSAGKVLFFNEEGHTTDSVTVTKGQTDRYRSLGDFLKSNESPISSCKHPTPTPPPPCILCDDGRVVCSTAAFKKAPPGDQPQGTSPPAQAATHSKSNASEVNKPQ